jgi:hypothetical protein
VRERCVNGYLEGAGVGADAVARHAAHLVGILLQLQGELNLRSTTTRDQEPEKSTKKLKWY